MTRRCLHRHDVTHLELKVVDILVERATGILESYLENIGREVVGILLEPRLFVQTEAATRLLGGWLPHFVYTKGATASNFGFVIF